MYSKVFVSSSLLSRYACQKLVGLFWRAARKRKIPLCANRWRGTMWVTVCEQRPWSSLKIFLITFWSVGEMPLGFFFNSCIFDNVFPDIILWPSSSAPAECQLKLVGCGRWHEGKWRELLTRGTTCAFLPTLMSPWRTAEPLMVGTSCCVVSFLTPEVLYLVSFLLQMCIQSESVCLVRKFPPLPAAEGMNHFTKLMKVGLECFFVV